MKILQATVEVDTVPGGEGWWPVPEGMGWRRVVLDGGLPAEEIGAVLGTFAQAARPETADAEDDAAVAPGEAVARIIGAETLPVVGGLVIGAEDGTLVVPGCCAELHNWRELAGPYEAGSWLGHDPAPWIQVRDEGIRVHRDGGLGAGIPAEPGFVDLSPAEIAAGLAGVQRDLLAFLDVVRQWSMHHVPSRAAELADALDRLLRISEAL